MAIEFNTGKTATTVENLSVAQDNTQSAQKAKQQQPILGGESLTVSSGAMTDLEKLVAMLKNETDEVSLDVTQRRISILQTVLNSMSDRISESEKDNLLKIGELSGQKTSAQAVLAGYESEKAATEGRIAELDVKIAQLEKEIEQAVQDGEDHRKQVEKLKKQRTEEQEKIDRLETSIASVSSKISGIDVKISECTMAIAQTTLNEVANALRIAANSDTATSTSVNEVSDESNADRVKEEKKEVATDIANVIKESLDKIDDQISKALDEANVVKA